jgi:hypothetical protein
MYFLGEKRSQDEDRKSNLASKDMEDEPGCLVGCQVECIGYYHNSVLLVRADTPDYEYILSNMMNQSSIRSAKSKAIKEATKK